MDDESFQLEDGSESAAEHRNPLQAHIRRPPRWFCHRCRRGLSSQRRLHTHLRAHVRLSRWEVRLVRLPLPAEIGEPEMALQHTTHDIREEVSVEPVEKSDPFVDPVLSLIDQVSEEEEQEERFNDSFTLRLDESDLSEEEDGIPEIQVEINSKDEEEFLSTLETSTSGQHFPRSDTSAHAEEKNDFCDRESVLGTDQPTSLLDSDTTIAACTIDPKTSIYNNNNSSPLVLSSKHAFPEMTEPVITPLPSPVKAVPVVPLTVPESARLEPERYQSVMVLENESRVANTNNNNINITSSISSSANNMSPAPRPLPRPIVRPPWKFKNGVLPAVKTYSRSGRAVETAPPSELKMHSACKVSSSAGGVVRAPQSQLQRRTNDGELMARSSQRTKSTNGSIPAQLIRILNVSEIRPITTAGSDAGGKEQSITTTGSSVDDRNESASAGLKSYLRAPSSVAPPNYYLLAFSATPISISATPWLQELRKAVPPKQQTMAAAAEPNNTPPGLRYKCKHCFRSFICTSLLQRHKSTCAEKVRCPKCDAILLRSEVISHFALVHSEPGSTTAVKPGLAKHKQQPEATPPSLPKNEVKAVIDSPSVDIRPTVIVAPPAQEVTVTPEAVFNVHGDSSAMAHDLKYRSEVSMMKSAPEVEVSVSVAQPDIVYLSESR